MEKSILFVDDEKAILKAIRREFFDSEFNTYYADSGKEALKILYENKDINMVVSDLMMPEMNGYELLKRIKCINPDIIKIVLSGYADEKIIFKAVNNDIAKVCISKPWENEDLIIRIREIFETYDKLNNKNIKNLLNSSNKLPTIPTLFNKINELIEDDNSNIEDIINLINQDQTTASKILKTANSSFYGMKTGSIKTAVINLGLANLKAIIASNELFSLGNGHYKNLLWEHSNLTNILSIEFYEKIYRKRMPDQYSTAGLLHDIGKVIFLKLFDKKYENLLKIKDENIDENLEIDEKNIFEFTHEELGSFILNWWQLPYPIVEVALNHSKPFNSNRLYRDIVCIVHLADYYSWKALYSKFVPKIDKEVYKYLNISKYDCEDIIYKYMNGEK